MVSDLGVGGFFSVVLVSFKNWLSLGRWFQVEKIVAKIEIHTRNLSVHTRPLFYQKSTISTWHRVFVSIMKREFINFVIVVGYHFSWLEGLIEYRHYIFVANDQATEWTCWPRGLAGWFLPLYPTVKASSAAAMGERRQGHGGSQRGVQVLLPAQQANQNGWQGIFVACWAQEWSDFIHVHVRNFAGTWQHGYVNEVDVDAIRGRGSKVTCVCGFW